MALEVKNTTANAGDVGDTSLILLGLGRCPGEGNGNPLQHSCPGKLHGQRSLTDYSPGGSKESDTTEQLTHTHT